jgi:hypothetical protein
MRRALVVPVVAAAMAFASACSKDGREGLEVSPNPVDFGPVEFPGQKTVDLTLRNPSGRTVLLGTPSFGCPCFTLTTPLPAVLGPGESRTLTLLLDSTRTDPRRFQKTMKIPGEGGKSVLLEVPIVGEVVQYLVPSAPGFDLGVLRPSASGPVERRLSLRPGDRFRLEPRGATVNDPRLRVSLVPAEGGGADLVLTVPEDAAPGPISAQVRAQVSVEGRGGGPRTLDYAPWVRGAIEEGTE